MTACHITPTIHSHDIPVRELNKDHNEDVNTEYRIKGKCRPLAIGVAVWCSAAQGLGNQVQ
jgi:hypothetical protein